MRNFPITGVIVLTATSLVALASTHPFDAKDLAESIKPILTRCQICHSGAKPAGNLDLSTRFSAIRSGTTLIPGNAAKSRVFQMVADRKMPPGNPLDSSEIETVRKWIESGAVWPGAAPAKRAGLDWWSLQPIKNRQAPPVKDKTWVRNAIDSFVLAKLESKGFHPAPEADRTTLIRRITFDLIGLPPTPKEIDSFVLDKSPNAYEKVVDRLLVSPHYGERWGRHWLDAARFAESQGFERDIIRDHAWRYRDYVIQAFNSDKPYNDFVREQIAGDVIAKPGKYAEGVIATGFLVAGPWDEVGNTVSPSAALRARVREDEMEDIVSAVSQTFLGMTVNCARCHDHKFDPIPQLDYYRLKAALDGAKHGNRSILTADETTARAAEVRKMRESAASFVRLAAMFQLRARNRALTAAGKPIPPDPAARWAFSLGPEDAVGNLHGALNGGAEIVTIPHFNPNGSLHSVKSRLTLNGTGAFLRTEPLSAPLTEKTLEAWAAPSNLDQRGGGILSIESDDGKLFDGIVYAEREPRKWIAGSESFKRTKDLEAPVESSKPGELIHMAAVYRKDGSIQLYRNGKPYAAAYTPNDGVGGIKRFEPKSTHILIGLRHTGAGNGFFAGEISEARLYDRALTAEEIAASYRAGTFESRPDFEGDERHQFPDASFNAFSTRMIMRMHEEIPQAYAANSVQPEPTFLLIRGETGGKGEQVTARGLSAIRTESADLHLAADSPEGQRRLKLAEWIVSPANPLTPRVIVNRIWHYHFGRGIVGSPNDFGFNGEPPSHPELLDWLASRFIAPVSAGGCGWSIKRLHRLILLSNTYRQSSHFDPKAAAQDSEDRLLWRFAPRRLEGEAVRDAMLSVSDLLNPQMGGPSFRPFTVYVNNSHFYTLTNPIGADFNRRTVYRMNVNSARSPLLETLDCPDPSTKTPSRSITTTPLQALALMNNAFVLRQADYFANRLRNLTHEPIKQIRFAYRLALGRPPSLPEESRAMNHIGANGLESLCWTLLNSSEFLYLK